MSTACLPVLVAARDGSELSLKELMQIDVASVSKRSQHLQEVATSIYVLTEEDIQRSGATRIQDVLKMVPGTWLSDISYGFSTSAIRESATPYPQSVLWILDGVPMTHPITGGFLFNFFDIPLQDIERIEVIKGPGGTIYGANAAAGIISIFTRSAQDSEGLQVSLDAGSQKYASPFLRFGKRFRDDLFVSAWGKFKTHSGYGQNPDFIGDSVWAHRNAKPDTLVRNRYTRPHDHTEAWTGGLKAVYERDDNMKITGNMYVSRIAGLQYAVLPSAYPESPGPKKSDSTWLYQEESANANFSLRLDYRFHEEHDMFINSFFRSNSNSTALGSVSRQNFSLFDLEAQNNIRVLKASYLSVGANLRQVELNILGLDSGSNPRYQKPQRVEYLMAGFIQDEIRLGEKVDLTVGAKAETWTLIKSEPELSPSIRLAYKPLPDLTLWSAASRSITTPGYVQVDIEYKVSQIPPAWYLIDSLKFPAAPPVAGKWVALVPGPDTHPTEYITYEAGLRTSTLANTHLDLSGFLIFLNDHMTITPLDITRSIPSRVDPAESIVPLYYANLQNQVLYGGEAIAIFMPLDFVKLEISYALLQKHSVRGLAIPGDESGTTYAPETSMSLTPSHIGRMRLNLELPADFYVSSHFMVSSSFSRGDGFDYVQQVWTENGVIVDPPKMQLQLDITVEKTFMREKVTFQVWGRNLLADPFVEQFNAAVWVRHPHKVHRTFGLGSSFRF